MSPRYCKHPPKAATNCATAVHDVAGDEVLSVEAANPEPEPALDYKRLLPALEFIELPLGHVLYEPDVPMTHAYFPVSGIISLLYVMENGESAEIAISGSEGMIGVSLFMGGESTTSRSVAQNAGCGYRLKAGILRREFALGGQLQHLLLRYTQTLIVQMTQTAACNQHHTLDQQLCRWLLLSLDRLPGDVLTMTQQLIANMLGVSTDGVTEALDKLQADGLIRYNQGVITVIDRSALRRRVCECYLVVKKEFDRLLPFSLAA
jgi:CRP-like cAMP-binding protein